MNQKLEVPPFIHTIGNEKVKNELYLKFFDVRFLGNIKGPMPIMGIDFNETEMAYAKRLKTWRLADMDVLFSDWKVKDLKQFQIATNSDGDSIQFDFKSYTITIAATNSRYEFPLLPETIDDFVNDCKRIGLKLFWKQEIIDKFGADLITSEKKVIEYHKILKQN